MNNKTEKSFNLLELELANYHNRFHEFLMNVPYLDKVILNDAIRKIERAHEIAVYHAAKDFVDDFEQEETINDSEGSRAE